ncbi:MAG: hypothetical protein JXQ67_01455 [Campylobacterales bacterium]|nr:hypothetical protein [Campylobacterales bacterium]
MKTVLFLTLITLLFAGCVNKHGVSAKYYSDCEEYYDYQGYYHKECGEDDIFTYEEVKEALKKKKPTPQGNVY